MKLTHVKVTLPSDTEYAQLVTQLIELGLPHRAAFQPPQRTVTIQARSKISEDTIDRLLKARSLFGEKIPVTQPEPYKPVWANTK